MACEFKKTLPYLHHNLPIKHAAMYSVVEVNPFHTEIGAGKRCIDTTELAFYAISLKIKRHYADIKRKNKNYSNLQIYFHNLSA
jgi:hypothetical protein